MDKELRGLFGRKGEIESSSVVFHPYYEADIDARIYEVKGLIRRKVEEKIVGATILIDAITGGLCNSEPDKGIVRVLKIPKLSDEEARVFPNFITPKINNFCSGIIIDLFHFQSQKNNSRISREGNS